MTQKTKIENCLKEVFDPEFPLVDIFTMGLIYDIGINEENKHINILMTFTSPMCPLGDVIIEMVKNSLSKEFESWEINVEITFDPMWSPEFIKDENIKQMFMG